MSRLLRDSPPAGRRRPGRRRRPDPRPRAPVAVTGAADSITETGADLNGTVDPNGPATTYHFEYGTSAAYGLTTPENTAPEGTEPVAVKAAIRA